MGLRPYSASNRWPISSVARCISRIISSVSSRVAPGAIAKLPEIDGCSGELKNRQETAPSMNSTTWKASTATAPASTG